MNNNNDNPVGYSNKRLLRIAIRSKIISKKERKIAKSDLRDRVMKSLNKSATRIQSVFRGFAIRRGVYRAKQAKMGVKYNTETLYGEPLEGIPEDYRVYLGGYLYDIRELSKIKKNPYTNLEFTLVERAYIRRMIRELRSKGLSEKFPKVVEVNSRNVLVTKLIGMLSDIGVYPNEEVFRRYNEEEIYSYLFEIRKYGLIGEHMVFDWFNEIRMRHIDIVFEQIDEEDVESHINEIYNMIIGKMIEILEIRDGYEESRALIMVEHMVPDILNYY